MKKIITAILTVMTVLSGCASQIPAYAPEPSLTPMIKGATPRLRVATSPATFSDDGSIFCRAVGPVSLPSGTSFTQYIAEALQQELKAGGAYEENSPNTLRLKLTRIDFQTTLGATNWYLDAEYDIKGERLSLSTVYNDRSSYLGPKACANMANYFRSAVAQHFRELFLHPAFRSQLSLPTKPAGPEDRKADSATRLRELERLSKEGLISKEEFEVQRKRILDGI